MAELFLARSTEPDGPPGAVVVKRLLPHMMADPHFNAMFIDEAKLTARLAHPNIVTTLEFNRHDDQLYMVMEYVDGLDGLAMLRECARRKVRLPTEVAVYIIHEVLHALDFAHNQVDEQGEPMHVVHRDISPSNVLVSRAGEIKLVDFGIARATQREHNTKDGTLKGKYGYMSPEQVIEEAIDARSDLFSVGIVLAELLTGRRLFAAPNELDVLLMVRDARLDRLDKYGGHIGLDLMRILRKSLCKHPGDRFASAAEFRDVLADWLYLHNHEVTSQTLAQIVDTLYQDAWRRKRENMNHASVARAALMADVSSGLPQQGREAGPARTDGSVQFVDMDPSEAVFQYEHIDGIPAGHHIYTDSLPEVSIEDVDMGGPGSEPGDASAAAQLDSGVVEAVHDQAPVAIHVNELTAGDDGGDAVPVLMDDLLSGPAALHDAGMDDSKAMAALEIAEDLTAFDFDDSEVSAALDSRALSGSAARSAVGAEVDLGDPDDSGEFAESPPIAVLYRLASARATGLLVAEAGSFHKEIYFRLGIPEYVSSNVPSELFGEYLTRQGELSPEQLVIALEEMPRYGGKLGDTLIAMGLLKPLQVFRLLTRQVRQKLVDVCTWSEGTFSWYGGRENPREAFPLDLNAFEIVGAGTMELGDDTVDAWLGTVSLTCQPRLVSNPRINPGVFQLGDLMSDVCRRLDGFHYLVELNEHYRASDLYARFVRVFYLLVHTGLAVV